MAEKHLTQIEFYSDVLKPKDFELDETHGDYINPNVYASDLADRIQPVLDAQEGVAFQRVVEDHGVHFYGEGHVPFTVHVVCTSLGDPEEHRHLVFVHPAEHTVRPFPWLKSYETAPFVPNLVNILRKSLEKFDDVSELSLVRDH